MTVDDLLAGARSRLQRVEPAELDDELAGDAVLVDIRSDSQRSADGTVEEAVFIPRNVLEWRCDPVSPWRDPRVSDPSRRVILMCDEGYQSSLAAAVLQDLGLPLATDLVGGFQAWRGANR
jgi:rhodanese-related sulfurtransferase